ncbi:hypothetical protein EYF80_012490 [Liparis tanakae]|uniref:Uncharacterized protein n=1 Tax=Liparis tanakae TaxID=230148 RepID=A0A4Z2IHL6_9TELE|nr:hypothetical protein EYF80_012490 [Liparis tanakae]
MMMSVKNHQIPPTILVERAFGMSSDPEREEQRRRTSEHTQTVGPLRAASRPEQSLVGADYHVPKVTS